VVSFFFFFSSPNRSHRRLDVCHTFDTWCGPTANLECRSEMCCARLAENAGPKNRQKVAIWAPSHNFCRAISSQLRHINNRKTRTPSSADRTARHQFQATGQPVSRTQASDAMTSWQPRYEAKCVQRRCFQWGVGPFAFRYSRERSYPLPVY